MIMKCPFGLRLWILIAALLLVAGGTIYGLFSGWRRVQEVEAKLTSSQIERFQLGSVIRRELQNLNASLFRYALLRDATQWAQFEEAGETLDHWIDEHDPELNPRALVTTGEERKAFIELNHAYDDYLRSARALHSNAQPALVTSGQLAQLDAFDVQAERMRGLVRQLTDAHRAAETAFLANASASLSSLRGILTASIVVLLALVGAMGWVIYRDTIAPLRTKLVQSQTLLERQQKLATLGTLAAGIAHEIRNPLTSLKARLYTLEKHLQVVPAARKDTEIISAEVSRLEHIVQDVLSFARPSDPKLETIAAEAVIREVQGLMTPDLKSRGVRLAVQSSPEFLIRADSGQLNQVLVNLVRNAAEATEGAGTITLRTRAARAPSADVRPRRLSLKWLTTATASRPKSRSACSTRSSARRRPARASGCRLPLASLKGTGACSSIKPGRATARRSELSCRAKTGTLPGMQIAGRILLIEDDTSLAGNLSDVLKDDGFKVTVCNRGDEGLRRANSDECDVVLTDLRLPGLGGLELVQQLHETQPRLPVVLMTAHGTIETAIEATKLGAYDYLQKPFEMPALIGMLHQAVEAGRLMREPVSLPDPPSGSRTALVGTSRAMQEVCKEVGRVAAKPVTVLIRGETGTGKELIARAIYQHSLRAKAPFIAINCAAVPENLLESELFGHERGAFTGANQRRIGRFEQANKGTLFLDEIGDLPPNTQVKLLRVLQQQTFQRVGGSEAISVDVRVIAATHRNLEAMVHEGKFREDLFHRLNVVCLQLPALRERREDVPLLVQHFLGKYAAEFGIESPAISSDAIAVLQGDAWPGNIRELENITRRLLLVARGLSINADAVRQALAAGRIEAAQLARTFNTFASDLLARAQKDELQDAHGRMLAEAETRNHHPSHQIGRGQPGESGALAGPVSTHPAGKAEATWLASVFRRG